MLAAFLPEAIGGLVIEMNRLITVGALVPILAIFMLGIFIPWADIWVCRSTKQATTFSMSTMIEPFNRRCRIYSGFHFLLAHNVPDRHRQIFY